MSLKSAVFELKEAILNKSLQMEENEIYEIECKHKVKQGTLVTYVNTLAMLGLDNQKESVKGESKINRRWSKFEIQFMVDYIKERQNEGTQNITDILDEVAQLLNRGYQSVSYKYYTVCKVKEKKHKDEEKVYTFKTIEQDYLPVIVTEPIFEPTTVQTVDPSQSSQEDDLLDVLSGLITNVQQLPGINLNELLKSLLLLTNMALKNKDVAQQLELTKADMSREKISLETELKRKEQQLASEMKRNDELQAEVSKLAKEVAAFNQLGDAAKVQNLKSYNQRLKYIIDGFGGVLKVGS